MTSQQIFAACTTALAIIASPDFAWPADTIQLPEFSATQTIGPKEGDRQPWKIYHSKARFRVEPSGGLADLYLPSVNWVHRLIGIRRPNPICFLDSLNDQNARHTPLQLLSGAMVQRTDAGSEVIDGHPCQVSNVVITSADGKTVRAKLWEAQDMQGFPIQIDLPGEGVTKTKTRFSDIVLGPPAPSLFVPPAKCLRPEEAGTVVEDTTNGLAEKAH